MFHVKHWYNLLLLINYLYKYWLYYNTILYIYLYDMHYMQIITFFINVVYKFFAINYFPGNNWVRLVWY